MRSHQMKAQKGPQCGVSTTILGLESLSLLNPDDLHFDSASRVKVKIAQLCPALCDPMDCSPPDSSVRGVLQGGALEWAPSFSRGSS